MLSWALQYYERILKNAGFPYIVNGAGGQGLNSFAATLEPGTDKNRRGSQRARYLVH